jgi:hypothetical protein
MDAHAGRGIPPWSPIDADHFVRVLGQEQRDLLPDLARYSRN